MSVASRALMPSDGMAVFSGRFAKLPGQAFRYAEIRPLRPHLPVRRISESLDLRRRGGDEAVDAIPERARDSDFLSPAACAAERAWR
jgi:hypothetical protein